MKEIKRLKYSSIAMCAREIFDINFNNNTAKVDVFVTTLLDGTFEADKELKGKEAKIVLEKFKQRIGDIDFDKLKERYDINSDLFITDCNDWELDITYFDGTEKHCSGYIVTPKEFKMLHEAFYDCFEIEQKM